MTENCCQPCPGYRRGTEQAFFALDLAHHEITWLEPPINVPLRRLVTFIEQHRFFRCAPVDRKLVFFREVADAAEIEDHDRLQRMLSFRIQDTVVNELHDAKQTKHRRNVENGCFAQGDLRQPNNVSSKYRRSQQGV